MKIFICFSFVFVLVSRVKGSCNDVCMASMTKSCEDTCRSSCSNSYTSGTNLDTSATTGGTELSASTTSVGQDSGATGITGGNNYGTSATMLDQSYTSPPPTDTSTPLDQNDTPQPLHLRKVRNLLRSDHVVFSDDDHWEAPPLRQEIVLLDSVDQSNVQIPSSSNYLQHSNNDGIFDGQLPINDRENIRRVRDIEGANLPERPDRIIFNAADKDVKLPFRQDVLLSRDEPINEGLPYRADALLSRDRNSRRVPSRFVRDLNGQLPQRPDRVVFGNAENVQLPMRKDALRSRDLPLPDNNSNGNGLQPQPTMTVDQNQTGESQQNTQSQCEPRCSSACMAQISTVCQQTCSRQTS